MSITTVTFGNGTTAIYTAFAGREALYAFGDGQVHVTASYYGQPARPSVTISLGRPGDENAYGLTGLKVGDAVLTGTVWCKGAAMTPRQYPGSRNAFALDAVVDQDQRRETAAFLSEIARHFVSLTG